MRMYIMKGLDEFAENKLCIPWKDWNATKDGPDQIKDYYNSQTMVYMYSEYVVSSFGLPHPRLYLKVEVLR